MASFTRRQWLIFVAVVCVDLSMGICSSLQGPLYPREAEDKGCTPSAYGFVFGIYQLVIFSMSPLYGKYMCKIGLKILFNGGIFLTGCCAILFGQLDLVNDHYTFITLSFIIRFVEALGTAAFIAANYVIISQEFPIHMSTTFASLETFYGLGLIVGPTVGGGLYELYGGFKAPFTVMGTILCLAAAFTLFAFPKNIEATTRNENRPSTIRALKLFGVLLAVLSILVTGFSIGFLKVALEPHLRQFNMTPIKVGLMFVINGAAYVLSSPGIEKICDKTSSPKPIIVAGTLLIATGFSLIGPAPSIPLSTTLWLTGIGLLVHGLGVSAQLVASFSDALQTSVAHGFPDDMETHGLISGIWTGAFALGSFVGSCVAGIIYEQYGFRVASMSVVGLNLLTAVALLLYLTFRKQPTSYVEIIEENDSNNGNVSLTKYKTTKSSRSQGTGISMEIHRSVVEVDKYTEYTTLRPEVASCLTLGDDGYGYGTIFRTVVQYKDVSQPHHSLSDSCSASSSKHIEQA